MKTNKKLIPFFIAAAVIICCALASQFLVQLAIIDGESMVPTYRGFQFVFVTKTDSVFQRGDVIAFNCENAGRLIKRIAAVPGDRIVIRGGRVFVNGEESPVYRGAEVKYPGAAGNEILLGDSEFFVLGDNLSQSKDSRYEAVGIVDGTNIIGKVIPQKSLKASR